MNSSLRLDFLSNLTNDLACIFKTSALAMDDVSKGYSGAEIVALCRDAALHAIGEMDDGIIERPQIHMKHMLRSIADMKPRTTKDMLEFYESFRGMH